MVAPAIAAVAAVAAPIIGGLIGEALAAGNYAEAERLEELQRQAYAGIESPELTELVSAYEGIREDPRGRTAQLRALDALQERSEGGLTFGDKLSLEDSMGDAAAYERGQRGAVQQSMASRGMQGGGLEAAQSMLSQQEGANRASRAGLDVAARAQERAYAALMDSGQLGGQVRQDDYRVQSDKARAQDEIARFNSQSKQQDFNNRLTLADRQADGYGSQAEQQRRDAERKRRMAGGIGQAVGYGAGAFGQGKK